MRRRCSTLDNLGHQCFLLRRRMTKERILQVLFAILLIGTIFISFGNVFYSNGQQQRKYHGLDLEVALKPPLIASALTESTLEFKIIQIPDMHYTGDPNHPCRDPPKNQQGPCTESNMTHFIARILDDEKPDFVVFSGDQIESIEVQHTVYEVNKALYSFSKEVIARSIPWSMVFGNHDEGDTMSKRDMFRRINAMPYSYSEYGPVEQGRVGNYALQIEAPTDGHWGHAGKSVLRLYFLDSEHGQFTTEQLEYVSEVASRYSHQNIPALMFFHNPLPEYADYDGKYSSKTGEPVSHAHTNSGLFETMVKMGDVKAAFVGHDHMNDYCFAKKGIHLCYGGGVGYGAAYANPDISRQARVITWKMSAKEEIIETYLHRDKEPRKMTKYKLYSRSLPSHYGLRGNNP